MSPDQDLTKTKLVSHLESSKAAQGGYLGALGALGPQSNPE